jgi:endoglucanase
MYAPYELVMKPDMDNVEFTEEYQQQLYENFVQVYKKYVRKGIHVVVGEMGFVNKNNTEERIKWGQFYMNSCRQLQFSAFIWDNGYWNNYKTCDDIFGHMKRDELEWENEKLIKAYIEAGQSPLEENPQIFTYKPEATFETDGIIIDHNEVEFDDTVTGKQIVDEMGFGWNLGNTFDAWNSSQNQGLESETCWGNPETTEEMIKYLVKTGFKAIRIPVTWHNHLVDDKYTIDPEWMRRVKTVVDWCIKNGLYVILNSHHDNAEPTILPIQYGKGYYPLNKDLKESGQFIYNIWKQIAFAFNNGYDHHLIFEGLNEPRLIGNEYEWWYNPEDWTCQEAADVLNEFHRIIHKAIRESGGNNAKRFIMVTALSAGYDATIRSPFVFPNDKKYNPDNNKLLLSVHMYAPYDFAMNPRMELSRFTDEYKKELDDKFASLYYQYVQKGYSIVAGEMGAINKNNTLARIQWGKHYIGLTRRYQASTFLWDNGYWDNTKTCDDIFGHLKRDKLTWAVPEVIGAWINAGKVKMWEDPEDN